MEERERERERAREREREREREMLITINDESYLTISKIESHFKHVQNQEMKN